MRPCDRLARWTVEFDQLDHKINGKLRTPRINPFIAAVIIRPFHKIGDKQRRWSHHLRRFLETALNLCLCGMRKDRLRNQVIEAALKHTQGEVAISIE